MDDTQRQIARKVLDEIKGGQSLCGACKTVGVKQSTFSTWVSCDDKLSDDYARARELCADSQFAEMDDLERQVLRGEIDPQTYRVVMESRKWRLARMHIKYNERQQVDVTAKVDSTSTHQLSDDATALLDKLIK